MDFKVGDVVRLKSGSPLMTIQEIGKYNYSDEDSAKCSWFDGKKRYSDIFELETLNKVE